MYIPQNPPPPSPRGWPQSRASVGQSRSSSNTSCDTIHTLSSTEEYCNRVAREAAMDIDAPVHSPSWADQMDLVDPLPPIDQFDLNDALPTSEQIELEYAQCAPPPTTEHVDYAPSPPPVS